MLIKKQTVHLYIIVSILYLSQVNYKNYLYSVLVNVPYFGSIYLMLTIKITCILFLLMSHTLLSTWHDLSISILTSYCVYTLSIYLKLTINITCILFLLMSHILLSTWHDFLRTLFLCPKHNRFIQGVPKLLVFCSC